MHLSNEVVLRPRFNIDLNTDDKKALQAFKDKKLEQSEFIITCVDHHVFIKIPKEKQHYWSPQLHLEIDPIDDDSSLLSGLFGPNPTVWTMFMFFHFIVAGLFIGFGVWAYSNWSLGEPFLIQGAMMILMVLIWFVLYYGGRMGKAKGNDEMHLLYDFMKRTLGVE
jgi:hypothetical protein